MDVRDQGVRMSYYSRVSLHTFISLFALSPLPTFTTAFPLSLPFLFKPRDLTLTHHLSHHPNIFFSLSYDTAIDYLQSLLTERQTLLQRLNFARSTLSAQNPSHPALHVSSEHMAPLAEGGVGVGVALWEREWGGGIGWGGDEDGDE